MNLHKAKGLEAAVVFLADPAGGVRRWVDVHIERTELNARGWLKIVRKNENIYGGKLLGEHVGWPAHEAAEQPYLEAEEDRLLYVAATRAREMLVISRSMQKVRTQAWGVVNEFLEHASKLTVLPPMNVAAVEPLDCGPALQIAAADERSAAHERVIQGSWAITSVTAEARHIARMTHFVDVSPDDPSKVVTADTPAHRADAGQAWGTLIHGLLEHAMRHKNASYSDLYRLAVWLSVEEPELRGVVDLAVETVIDVAKADFWKQATQHEDSEETPFAAPLVSAVAFETARDSCL